MTEKIIQRVIGYILLLPALFSVYILFYLRITGKESIMGYDYMRLLGDGYTPSMASFPIFIGLLTIAGAYLIINSKDK